MITVSVYVLPQEECIVRVDVSGHAGYAPEGSDIVCAAVSMVSFGTVHAIGTLTGVQITVHAGARGQLDVVCSEDQARVPDVQLLLRGMEAMMQLIAHHYPDHVRIVRRTEGERRGSA
ncbi:MAG: ribosomal-processing cysteine protease Prp [Paenibacillaceae bacterium]|nr:ribosomal-processing cysteine protease Prp [Paenibacillaceae bacterium]